jgi:hypothetical protein
MMFGLAGKERTSSERSQQTVSASSAVVEDVMRRNTIGLPRMLEKDNATIPKFYRKGSFTGSDDPHSRD